MSNITFICEKMFTYSPQKFFPENFLNLLVYEWVYSDHFRGIFVLLFCPLRVPLHIEDVLYFEYVLAAKITVVISYSCK